MTELSPEEGAPSERRLQESDLLAREREAEIARLRQELDDPERIREYDVLQDRLVDAEQELARIPTLQQRIEELESQLNAANRATVDARNEITELNDRLTEQARMLSDVFNSPSWRVTGPLRRAKRLLRGD